MILETERLMLREMTPADRPALCRILMDAETMTAYEGAFNDAEVDGWLAKQMDNYRVHGFGLWMVILKETGEAIGQCGLTLQNAGGEEKLEVGYLFNRAYWHHGYAAEAAVACREYAFAKLEAHEVCSIIRDTNQLSQNVAKRNGMACTGRFVKHYRGVDMPHLVFTVQNPKAKRCAKAR